MNISIIGSNGFLSTAFGQWANDHGYRLNVYGRQIPFRHSYDRFVKCDLMKTVPNSEEFMDSDIVVYAAGAGIQSNYNESIDVVFRLNVTVPMIICNGLKCIGYNGCFVSFGSVFEVGVTKEQKLFSEEDIISSMALANSDYVVSKRMFSRFVNSYCHEYTHWHFILPTIYGCGENPNRLVSYTINSILENKELHYTESNQTRLYLSVDEVPYVIKMSFDKKLHSGIYNIKGKETLKVREIVALICKSLGVQVPDDCFGTTQRPDTRMEYLALDGEKLHQAIGFEPRIGLSEMIAKYKKFWDNDGRRG